VQPRIAVAVVPALMDRSSLPTVGIAISPLQGEQYVEPRLELVEVRI